MCRFFKVFPTYFFVRGFSLHGFHGYLKCLKSVYYRAGGCSCYSVVGYKHVYVS